ncbi:MAG: hypothetical protein ABW219_09265 [Ilumatobacteraceae bacterium]
MSEAGAAGGSGSGGATGREPRITGAQLGGLASLGAGAIHAAAAGVHAEHVTLSRLFVLTAVAQLVVGLLLLVRAGRVIAAATVAVNGVAVGAWIVTRTSGASWVAGLEVAEDPGFADTVCALLGALAVGGALAVLVRETTTRPARTLLGVPAVAIGAITVAAMLTGATDVHSHDDGTAAHEHTDDGTTTESTAHEHAGDEATTEGTAHDHADEGPADTGDTASVDTTAWPRPWDPAATIDFSGVAGVTPEQQDRAEALAASTIAELPTFADVSAVEALGFQSIGDAGTGFEHYINPAFVFDDHFLDPSYPETLVYQVDGDQRTLVSAMFIAKDKAVDDPDLIDWGGPLMQWHVHEDLCWSLDESGQPKVSGVTDDAGRCPQGSVNAGGRFPMVHVWIAPHECGPFAALEGHGAGQVATTGARADQCSTHEHASSTPSQPATVAYDPTKPIDLSGVEGVTPEQQAYAENLVAVTLVKLPQWSDPAVAEAAGFHSIGDEATGFEHYIQWDWIDDDVFLDPDAPESLVYRAAPDGSKTLVSAMYMLPTSVALEDVPDFGGTLMQWHVHDNLCYTDDPVAPQVRGVTQPDGTCRAPLVKHEEAPMIHVWITPHECGPFAALEGVGAGAIPEGEERWCDHVHGS